MPEEILQLLRDRVDAFMGADPDFRLDANETAVLVQQLEHMLSREQQIRYAPLKALSFFPVSAEVDPGADTYSYEVWDEVGMAKIIANYAHDLPIVGISARKVTGTLHSMGVGYMFSRNDMRRAAKSGKPLVDRRRAAALRAMDRKADAIVSTGENEAGLMGILNHPNITIMAAADPGTGSDTTWNGGDKTNAEILADLNELAKSAWLATKENWAADTLLLPPERFTFLKETPWSADHTDSILTVFLKNSSFIRNVDSWGKLSTAGANDGPAALAYKRDPMCLEFHYPMRPSAYEPQAQGLNFLVPMEARIGGIALYEPLSVVRMDLI